MRARRTTRHRGNDIFAEMHCMRQILAGRMPCGEQVACQSSDASTPLQQKLLELLPWTWPQHVEMHFWMRDGVQILQRKRLLILQLLLRASFRVWLQLAA